MALAVYPAARLSARYGRRLLSVGAMLTGICGCLVAALSVQASSFWGFTLAALMFGAVGAVVQQFRFLAMSVVPPEQQAGAASKLLLAGLVSAFLGPQLSVLADYFPQWGMSAPFAGLAMCFLAAAVVLWCVIPVSTQISQSSGTGMARSWAQLFRQPDLPLAMSAAAVGYAVMSFVMTATPLSMTTIAGHDVADARWIIQSHIAAMFLPSLFTPLLVRLAGLYGMMWLGGLAFALSLVIGWHDVSLLHYWGCLVLLGIGWNFLFVSGTAMLARCYQTDDAAKVQGMNDLLVFGTQATGSLCSGAVLLLFGWPALLMISSAGLLWLLALLLWNQRRRVG